MLRSARFLDDNLDGELVPDFVVRMYLRGKIGYRLLYNNYIIHLKKEKILPHIRKNYCEEFYEFSL